MQTVRKMKKRSGFTLVELLIVIIIIGILAGAMLLVAGSGTDTAEATKIVSDLRSLKAAALMYYADGNKTVPADITGLQDYMDKKMETGSNYKIEAAAAPDSDDWYVGKTGIAANSGVAKALAKNAKGTGLWPSKSMSGDEYKAADTEVWMKAR